MGLDRVAVRTLEEAGRDEKADQVDMAGPQAFAPTTVELTEAGPQQWGGHGTHDHPFRYDIHKNVAQIGPFNYFHDDVWPYNPGRYHGRISPDGTAYWNWQEGAIPSWVQERVTNHMAEALGGKGKIPESWSDDDWDDDPDHYTSKRSNILDPIHDTLDPRIWDDEGAPAPKLKPGIKKWIQREVFEQAKQFHPSPEKWLRLVLTGSLTTYQYSEQSDVDVSLFVSPHFLPEWSRGQLIGLMVQNMDGTKVPGTPFPIQCFVVGKNISTADLYQPGLRSGYDIEQDTWLVPPDRTRAHDVEREQNLDWIYALESADKMERLLRYDPERAVDYWHQIHRRRMRDQSAGKGDFSQANIVYKMLANRGLFPSLSDASGEYIA